MSLVITQGYGTSTYIGSFSGTIPDYSSVGDVYTVSVVSSAAAPITVVFDQEITGLLKDTQQQ